MMVEEDFLRALSEHEIADCPLKSLDSRDEGLNFWSGFQTSSNNFRPSPEPYPILFEIEEKHQSSPSMNLLSFSNPLKPYGSSSSSYATSTTLPNRAPSLISDQSFDNNTSRSYPEDDLSKFSNSFSHSHSTDPMLSTSLNRSSEQITVTSPKSQYPSIPLPALPSPPTLATTLNQLQPSTSSTTSTSKTTTLPTTSKPGIGKLETSPLSQLETLGQSMTDGGRSRPVRTRNPTPKVTKFQDFKELEGDEFENERKKGKKRPRAPRVKDRKKHNEAETLRRRRMKSSFTELAKLCGMDNAGEAHKAAILKAAIAKVQEMEAQLRDYENTKTSSSSQMTSVILSSTSSSSFSTPSSILKDEGQLQSVYDSVQKVLLSETGSSSENPVNGLIDYAQVKGREVKELNEYKKRAENVISSVVQLLKQQVNYHSIFNCSSVAEDIVNLDGRIIDCNLSFTRLLGYSRNRVLTDPSLTIYKVTHPDSYTLTCVFIQSLFSNSPRLSQTIKKFITADGRHVWARVTAWITQDDTGKPGVIRGVFEPFVPTLQHLRSIGTRSPEERLLKEIL